MASPVVAAAAALDARPMFLAARVQRAWEVVFGELMDRSQFDDIAAALARAATWGARDVTDVAHHLVLASTAFLRRVVPELAIEARIKARIERAHRRSAREGVVLTAREGAALIARAKLIACACIRLGDDVEDDSDEIVHAVAMVNWLLEDQTSVKDLVSYKERHITRPRVQTPPPPPVDPIGNLLAVITPPAQPQQQQQQQPPPPPTPIPILPPMPA